MIKLILVIQFVLELQQILRLAFSPMQLDFESAPFSHLGTSPNTRLLYQHRKEKSRHSVLVVLLFCRFYHHIHSRQNPFIVFPLMRKDASGTVLDSAFRITKPAATTLPQRIQRAIAKQTIEFFGIYTLMTGKILTFPVLKKLMMQIFFLHSLSHLPQGTSSPRTIL